MLPENINDILKKVADRADPQKDKSEITYAEFTTLAGFIQTMAAPEEKPMEPIGSPSVYLTKQVPDPKARKFTKRIEYGTWVDPYTGLEHGVSDMIIEEDDPMREILRLCQTIRTGVEVRIPDHETRGIIRDLECIEGIARLERENKKRRR